MVDDIIIRFTNKDFEKVADIEVSQYKFSNAELFMSKFLQNGFDEDDMSPVQKQIMDRFCKDKSLEFIFKISPDGKITGEIKKKV